MRILRSPADWNANDILALYAAFESPIAALDCGQRCAPHNPNGKPFCCDICQAVPAAYASEWQTLQARTRLWHEFRGDECLASPDDSAALKSSLPEGMIFLACLGPQACEREHRLLACRQFPFFPYVSSDYRFLGLSYDWEFEEKCWVVSHLAQVTPRYRAEFVAVYDQIFALFQDEFDAYALRSQEMRQVFAARRRRIPLLHRNGGFHLISPGSERAQRVTAQELPRFAPYDGD
ncbi:MAG: hypothetical protein Fur0035_19220 [Anaerolineales bacterium]